MKRTLSPAQIIGLARLAGVPFGAHAFVVIQAFEGGETSERAFVVNDGNPADKMRALAESLVEQRSQVMTSSEFFVLEVGAPIPDADKLYADGFADGANQQGGYCFGSSELATVIAALRFWQRQGNIDTVPEWDIATDGGEVSVLDNADIDALCEALNGDTDNAAQLRRLIANGLEFGTVLNVFGEHQAEKKPELLPYSNGVENTRTWQDAPDGDVVIDDAPLVSKGDANGAYVLAWIWVSDEDAGVFTEIEIEHFDEDPDGDEDRAGDGYYFRKVGDETWSGAWGSEEEAKEMAREDYGTIKVKGEGTAQ